MISRLAKTSKGGRQLKYPSVVLVLEPEPETTYMLHIVPEDGAVEQSNWTQPKSTSVRYGDAKERSREPLGTVILQQGEGETARQFLQKISVQASEIIKLGKGKSTEDGYLDAVDEALRSAVTGTLHEKEKQVPPVIAAELYEVYLAQVDRSKPRKIITDPELRSVARW